MTVLIVAPEDDEHAVAVAAEIAGSGGRAEVLDLARFPERATLCLQLDCCGDDGSACVTVDGRSLDLDEVSAVWWRRAHYPTVADGMRRPTHRAFAANETYEALGGLWARMDARWVNEPSADDRGHRKGYQLSVARRLGIPIPRTLMTNDPDRARQFVDSLGYREVVYKSFSATKEEWRETRLLKPEEMTMLEHVRHAPVIFQQYVPAEYDLRVTVVGDRLFPAAIHSQQTAYPVDSRIDIANARIQQTEIPDEVRSWLLDLTRTLGLVYAAADLRLTPDGEYVFLEVNPSGQFLYIEAATGLPISAAMARLLLTGQA